MEVCTLLTSSMAIMLDHGGKVSHARWIHVARAGRNRGEGRWMSVFWEIETTATVTRDKLYTALLVNWIEDDRDMDTEDSDFTLMIKLAFDSYRLHWHARFQQNYQHDVVWIRVIWNDKNIGTKRWSIPVCQFETFQVTFIISRFT